AAQQPPAAAQDERGEPEPDHEPDHDDPCGFAIPSSGCADRTPSSACRAARASSEDGATTRIFCQTSAAPFRSCLPKARTMPMLSSVLACDGSIASDRSNCASALSGSFM